MAMAAQLLGCQGQAGFLGPSWKYFRYISNFLRYNENGPKKIRNVMELPEM